MLAVVEDSPERPSSQGDDWKLERRGIITSWQSP